MGERLLLGPGRKRGKTRPFRRRCPHRTAKALIGRGILLHAFETGVSWFRRQVKKLTRTQRTFPTMSKPPPVPEPEFLKLSGNHQELTRKLSTLACPVADILEYAKHLSEAWFRLGEQHLNESKLLNVAGCPRASYSRAYYAVYNASKAARYIVHGSVSLKGDDHGRASRTSRATFLMSRTGGVQITELYKYRLRADYDNWATTTVSFTLQPAQAIARAEDFLNVARGYLNSKYGMTL